LAAGKEVVVSRGEAVQIGGGFRIPDILTLSGARLVEVGTTNVTTIDDYLKALGPDTAMALVVHRSNFALRGFAESPRLSALAKALPHGLPLVVDQGSGFAGEAATEEDSIQRIVKSGASLVCFSGDKIFGGPQSGIIVGKAELVARLSRHPLMRTFRPGKTILSITEAVLIERLGRDPRGASARNDGGNAANAGARAPGITAVERALSRAGDSRLPELRTFGRKIVRTLPPGRGELIPSRATIGGGSTPDEFINSLAIRLKPLRSAERLARALRSATVPLVARIEGEDVLIDLLTLADEDPRLVSAMIIEALTMEHAT
jgi:L-seryl-tRNA(Ser) seleniumtransferase